MIQVNSQLQTILKSTQQRPVMRVDVFPTSNTVPSLGFTASYYSGCLQSGFMGAPIRIQNEAQILNSYAYGLPLPLSNYVSFNINPSGIFVGQPYTVSWSGYFYSAQSGNYTFATRAYGGTRFLINGQDLFGNSGWNNFPGKPLYFSGIANLSSNTWTPIEVDFGYFGSTLSGVNFCHIEALFTPPSGTEIPLTASSVSPSGAFLQPNTLINVMDIKEDRDTTNTTQMSFEVPIIQGGSYIWNFNKSSYGLLKPNNLVDIYVGYATQSGYIVTSGYTTNLAGTTDFVKRMRGFINAVSINQQQSSVTATVTCQDFTKKTINAINNNFPNFASYLPSITSKIDPLSTYKIDYYMPAAYDNWYIVDALKDLLLKAGIDPIYMSNSLINIGNYFRLEKSLAWPNTSYTDQYGQTFVDKAPFLYQFPYGNKISDLINQLCDLIGYQFRFDEQGNVFIKDPRYTSRIEAFETSGINSSAVSYSGIDPSGIPYWTAYYNPNCSNGIFFSNIASGVFGDNDSLVAKNTLAIYNFENNSKDYSSYGFDLITVGNVPYITSNPTPKQGLYAAGPFNTGNYFSSPPSLDNNMIGLGAYSIEFYVYPINVLNTGIIYSYNSGYIALQKSGVIWNTGGQSLSTANNLIKSGNWYHIGCSYDGINKTIYISGIQQATFQQGGIGTYPLNTIGSQQIGNAYINGIASGIGSPLSGYLDQFRISNISHTSFPTLENTVVVTSGSNVNANVSFSGVGFSVWYGADQYGATSTINVYTQSNNQLVLTTGINSFYPQNTYGNFQFVTNTLPYSGYKITINPVGLFKLEAVDIYEKNIWQPSYTFRANEDISLIDLEFTDQDLRNEVMVVGQQIVGGQNITSANLSTNPNANNRYLYSRAVDLDSIWNPNASNYVGQERMLVLVEPRLQSQRRIDWLASSILQRYNKNERNITLGLPGEPQLQINDAIGIVSNKIGLNTDTNITLNSSGQFNGNVSDVFYINKLSSDITQKKYITNVGVTSLPPIDSWRSFLPPTKTLVTGFINTFGSVFTNWKVLVNNSPLDPNAYDDLSLTPEFVSFNSFINLDRLWVFVDDRSLESFTQGQTSLGVVANPTLSQFGIGGITLNSPNPINKYITQQMLYTGLYTGVSVPGNGVFLHNGGGELAGNLVLPNAMDSDFGGGQFYAQNSNNNPRLDGTFPVWIWGQGTFSDGTSYFTNLWQVPSGTTNSVTIQGLTYPALKIKSGPTVFTFKFDPYNTGNFIKMIDSSIIGGQPPLTTDKNTNGFYATTNFQPGNTAYTSKSNWQFTTNHLVTVLITQVAQIADTYNYGLDPTDASNYTYDSSIGRSQTRVHWNLLSIVNTASSLPFTLSSVSSNTPTQIYPGAPVVLNPIQEYHINPLTPGKFYGADIVNGGGVANTYDVTNGNYIAWNDSTNPAFRPPAIISYYKAGNILAIQGTVYDAHTNAALQNFTEFIFLNS